MLIDTHAHLFSEKYDEQKVDEIVKNMQQNNLEYIIASSASRQDCYENIKLANKYENVFCTLGVHPEVIEQLDGETLCEIEKLSKNSKVVAIGEIGLDYHVENFNKNAQIEGFLKQAQLAHKLKKPIVIHLRDAYEDMLKILQEHKNLFEFGFDVHCYSGSKDFAKELLKLGAYFSFTGNITFKNAKKAIEVIEFLPVNRIMIETDSPYMSPEPFRGTRNEPKNVKYVFNKICEIKNIDKQELDKIIRENVRNFYKI
ncbi:MAG: TatD family hydrolase [Christensenellales bacterium]